MGEFITRNPREDEIPLLRNMWRTVFGGEGEASFFEHLFSVGHTVVAEQNDKLAAMGYMVPMGDLLNGETSYPCAMLYAIATIPEHRGKGLGAAVVNELVSTAHKLGYPAAVLCPSEESLFDYYSARTQFREWFYTDEKGISGTSTIDGCALKDRRGRQPPRAGQGEASTLIELSPGEYKKRREALLNGMAHIKHSLSCIEYQKLLCDELGGGLFKASDSCAVVEVHKDGVVHVKELLAPDGDDGGSMASAIAAAFPAHEYIYRFPARDGQRRRFGMLAMREGMTSRPHMYGRHDAAPWYGLALD